MIKQIFRGLGNDEIFDLISQNDEIIQVLPFRFKMNLRFLKELLRRNPIAADKIRMVGAAFTIKELFSFSYEEQSELLSENGLLLKYLSQVSTVDDDNIILALSQNPAASVYVCKGQIKEDTWYAICKRNPSIVAYMPPKMLKALCDLNPLAVTYMPTEILKDFIISSFYSVNIWEKIRSCDRATTFLCNELIRLRDSSDYDIINFLEFDRTLARDITNKDFVLKLLSILTSSAEDKKLVFNIMKKLSPALRADEETVYEIVSRNGLALVYADIRLKKNGSAVAKAAVEQDNAAKKYVRVR
jgi:hypothetical protein